MRPIAASPRGISTAYRCWHKLRKLRNHTAQFVRNLSNETSDISPQGPTLQKPFLQPPRPTFPMHPGVKEVDLLHSAHDYRPRNYQGEAFSIWHRLPVARRASVFVLLFLGHLGELRVVLTKRSSQLRSFPGHISLPGGKADTGLESPWTVARREMSEEIGLSDNDAVLSREFGFAIDNVTELPCYLSRTFSAVKPCVGFMNVTGNDTEEKLLSKLALKVNPGESSSIFSCPLRDFLYPSVEEPARESLERTCYKIKWGGIPWNLRSYTFPQANSNEVHWLQGFDDISASDEEADVCSVDSDQKTSQTSAAKTRKDLSSWGKLGSRRDSTTNEKIYDVWGLTANILHDLAEVIYSPESGRYREHGEEELIWSVWHYGHQLRTKERSEAESRLISSTPSDDISFGDLLPRTEFNRLKRLYKM